MNMADVSDDGTTVSIKLKAGATEYDPAMGYMVTISAKDEVLGVTETQDLMVVRNAPPSTDADDTGDLPDLLIGTQPAKSLMGSSWPGGDDYVCDMMNSCVLTPMVDSATTNREAHFHDFGDLTFTAVSSDPSKVAAAGGAKITLTGMATTHADGNNRFAMEGVTITVTAMDAGGVASAEKTFKVIVNAQPARNDVAIPGVILDDGPRMIATTLFFADAEGATGIRYEVLDNAGTQASVTAAVDLSSGVLTLTPTLNGINGSREVTVRAMESPGSVSGENASVGQYLDMMFNVSNTSN
jgi:hypothetical protein